MRASLLTIQPGRGPGSWIRAAATLLAVGAVGCGAVGPSAGSGEGSPVDAPGAAFAPARAAAPAPGNDGGPVVAPTGASAPAASRSEPRLTSIADKTWIWPKPRKDGRFLGTMRIGQSVALRSPERVPGEGCARGFFQIEPRGYVCADRTVTLERTTPFLQANAHTLPSAGPHPYRFAISSGAPMYARLPTAEEQRRSEWSFGPAGEHLPLPPFSRGHEHLAVSTPIAPVDEVPSFLADGGGARGKPVTVMRRTIPHGAMFSFTRAFDFGGRTFLLSTDLTVVPADRVREFRLSDFEGTVLGGEVRLPIAWIRFQDRPRYQLGDGGAPRETGGRFGVRTWYRLTGKEHPHEGRTYLEVRDPSGSAWLDAAHATVVRDYGKRPFGVMPGDKWILVSISDGTLIAYDDLEPVFTTLISPGLGGIPRKGGDLVKDSTTPLGIYRITFKDRATTMSPEFGEDRSFWIADVPFTQYFSPPFALHTAYWHERFGELMSGGCINASPKDGEWLFQWTEPHVPDGWQGATGGGFKDNGRASWIVVRR